MAPIEMPIHREGALHSHSPREALKLVSKIQESSMRLISVGLTFTVRGESHNVGKAPSISSATASKSQCLLNRESPRATDGCAGGIRLPFGSPRLSIGEMQLNPIKLSAH